MNHRSLIIAAIATTFGASALADNFGGAVVVPKPVTTVATTPIAAAPVVAAPVAASGPQLADAFRIVKPDGATLIAQGILGASVAAGTPINVSDKDAFLVSGGKCAFNVKYDEVSATAATGTTNRLYSNDTLIAQNTKIDLVAKVVRTIWTQPYLVPGVNNVRVVVNADSAAPSTKWVRVNVSGTCGAALPVTPPVTAPVVTPPVVKPVTPPPVTPPPVVHFAPGSSEWNNLNNMWG